ncbi:hypothetical protein [Flavobacterium sp. FlaQc-48]|uniref:hypothetical protein n=1 Tax=Flavobacterium sp. FlaQc-48 TaxID=3374181 RepID=UPI003757774B
MTDKNISFDELFSLISSKRFLTNIESIPENLQWQIETDTIKALESITNLESGSTNWIKLRQKLSLPIEQNFYAQDDRDPQHHLLQTEQLGNLLEVTLKGSGFEMAIDEIMQDFIIFTMLPTKNLSSNLFFYDLYNAYKSGYLPCGWKGDYPEGDLIVYQKNSI